MDRELTIISLPLKLEQGDEEVSRLLAYWNAQRRDRQMPVWKDFDVVALTPWLGRLNLFDVLDNTDLRCRLRGSKFIALPRLADHGAIVSEVGPAPVAELGRQHMLATYAAGQPSLYRIALSCRGLSFPYVRLALPFAPDGAAPPSVLTFIQFDIGLSRAFWERYAARDDKDMAAEM